MGSSLVTKLGGGASAPALGSHVEELEFGWTVVRSCRILALYFYIGA